MSSVITKNELRDESLSYLRGQLHQLLKTQPINKFDKLTTNNLNYQLSITLVQTLNNDIEVELQDQLTKLQHVREEYYQQKKEFSIVKEITNQKIAEAHNENEKLAKNFSQLEKYLMSLRSKHQKVQYIERNETEIRPSSILSFSNSSEIKNKLTTKDIATEYKKLHIRNIKEIEEVKKKCADFYNKAQKTQYDKLYSELKIPQIEKENEIKSRKLKELEEKYKIMIKLLNKKLKINLSSTFNADEMMTNKECIKKALNNKVENYKQKLVSEIQMLLPGIDVSETCDMSTKVYEFINSSILEKENECQRTLKRSEMREAKLKANLSETLKELNEITNSIDSSSILDEIDAIKSEWRQEKESLDRKMSLLSQKMNVFSSSSLNNPL